MNYSIYGIVEVFGEYETSSSFIVEWSTENELNMKLREVHSEWRGSDSSDYDPDYDAYWFSGNLVKAPQFQYSLTEETFNVIKDYMMSI